MRFISRYGKPLLLFPETPALASQALTLYPAQSPLGKAAKALLQIALRLRCCFLTKATTLPVARDNPFTHFVTQTAELGAFPRMAILAGNPNVSGRRFVLLLFNHSEQPCTVIKAGMGEAATCLIEQERAFLESATADHRWPFINPLKDAYRGENFSAIAMPFIKGTPPVRDDWEGVNTTLQGWLHKGAAVPLFEIPAWQRLATAAGNEAVMKPILNALGQHSVRPVLFHGDFAPWNVRKTAQGSWMVLDWERGELTGIPGWDWFHWLIHISMLVLHLPPKEGAAWIRNILRHPSFLDYSQATQIQGIEPSLLIAYLAYLEIFVASPTNQKYIKALLEVLSAPTA